MIYLGEDRIKELEFDLAQPDVAYSFFFFKKTKPKERIKSEK